MSSARSAGLREMPPVASTMPRRLVMVNVPSRRSHLGAGDAAVLLDERLGLRGGQHRHAALEQRVVEAPDQRIAHDEARAAREAHAVQAVAGYEARRVQQGPRRLRRVEQMADVGAIDHHAAEQGELGQRRAQVGEAACRARWHRTAPAPGRAPTASRPAAWRDSRDDRRRGGRRPRCCPPGTRSCRARRPGRRAPAARGCDCRAPSADRAEPCRGRPCRGRCGASSAPTPSRPSARWCRRRTRSSRPAPRRGRGWRR